MTASLIALSLLFLTGNPQPLPEVISPDGGEVPTVAPNLTPRVAPILAPELVADGGTVIAQETLSVYDVDLPVEATITAGSLALFLVVDLMIKPTLEGDVSCRRPIGNGRCDPADLTEFDRLAVGRESKEWKGLSDATLAAGLMAPIVYLGIESLVLPTTDPWGDWGGDLLVVSESMALTGAIQVLMKFAFRRPRPVRYTDVEIPLSTFDQELSFPSGHVALVASSGAALTTTIFFRHPKSQLRYLALGTAVVATTLTAVGRVQSGQHFPTDVILGATLGGVCGFLVPYIHRHKPPVMPSASFNPATGESMFSLGGTF